MCLTDTHFCVEFAVLYSNILLTPQPTWLQKRFFRNFSSITLYAVLGTIISTFLIGMLVYAFAKAGAIKVDATSPLQRCVHFFHVHWFLCIVSANSTQTLTHDCGCVSLWQPPVRGSDLGCRPCGYAGDHGHC